MVEPTRDQIAIANERGRIAATTEPRAASARYDATTQKIVIELTNGATFAFPPALAQDLCDATPKQLADIELSPGGFGLHWPQIDTDFTVSGLAHGRFGSAKWMAGNAR